MAEIVGGAFLSACLEVLVERLASPEVLNFFRENHSMAELLEKLNITLWSANTLLNDAEYKQVKDGNIKYWVDKLNEVLHEADNMMDEIKTEALRCKIEKGQYQPRCSIISTRKLAKLVPDNSFNAFEEAMKQKIEKVIDMLKFLLDQKDFLGLKEGVQSKHLERLPAPLIGDPSDIYGRDGDKETIVKSVLSESINGGDKISVIPIVGMGGIGKTTLARLIYDDSRVKNHFEHRAWVIVSDDFDARRLAKLVFKELTSEEPGAEDLGKLRDKLKEKVSGKKFLLVLDDVWNENYSKWNDLKSFLEFEANGSKVVVTTRNESIARMMGSVQSYPLETMSNEDCWQLFSKHVFRKDKANTCQDLEKIGKDIVKKCKGLPLAVMSLAGLLCLVSDPNEWKEILESEIWELQKKGNDEILPSLWLSYHYLPSHLKRCFAYCSIFPKDYEYKKEEIILLWMAEGLLYGENMEQVGEEYIKILISRSLFQRSSKDESIFRMHGLVHDLATFVSGKGFVIRLSRQNDLQSLTNKTRHLLCEGSLNLSEKDFKSFSKANKCLRTLIAPCLVSYIANPDACLRVLCLSGLCISKESHSIGKLKHLRYLDLSKSVIERLPDAICTLYNLQTLLLSGCRYLTLLPANMEKLINLRHLDITDTTSLKIRIEQLRKLPNLHGRLEVIELHNFVDVIDVMVVGIQKCLTELILNWYGETNDSQKEREVLNALQPHVNLKKLEIKGYQGTKFSDWVADISFSNVIEVSLDDSKYCCHLPPFGQLPSLKRLKIRKFDIVETVNSEFYGSVGTIPFRSLEKLEFQDMKEWRYWSSNGGNELEAKAFPCLKELQIANCGKLNSPLPYCFPSLTRLEIWNCEEMEDLLQSGQLMNTAFPSLMSMSVASCPKLESSGLPFPLSLTQLSLSDCGKLMAQRMQWGLKALKKLMVNGGWDVHMDLFPEEGLLPTTLINLDIYKAPNLKALNGKVFQHLTSLQALEIFDCPKLQCLPEGLPASLSSLYIKDCLLIESRLERKTGEDWHKISHIPKIRVNRIYISDEH